MIYRFGKVGRPNKDFSVVPPRNDKAERDCFVVPPRNDSKFYFSHLSTIADATALPTTLVAERPMSSNWSTANNKSKPSVGI